MFANPFPHAFGLDINDTSIKMVQLKNTSLFRPTPHFDLIAARAVDLPEGLIVDGEIMQPEPVRKYIMHLLTTGKKNKPIVHSPWVIASLPEKQSFIKVLTIPKPPEDIMEDDVLAYARQHIPFDDNSYYIDWQYINVESKTARNTNVLIAVTSKHIADMYTYLLESIGFGVVALEIESLALARSMITASKVYDGEARAILDIGQSKTVLLVYDNDSIQFSIALPFSGDKLTKSIEQTLRVTREEAEQIKMTPDLKNRKKNAWPLIMKSGEELAKHVKKAINFYYSHFSGSNRITHITMTGGSAMTDSLNIILTESLGIKAEPGLPWKNLRPKRALPVSQEDGLRYATAIGLALRAADNPYLNQETI